MLVPLPFTQERLTGELIVGQVERLDRRKLAKLQWHNACVIKPRQKERYGDRVVILEKTAGSII